MFIFNRPFRAVGAALGVALLIVVLDRLCQPADPPAGGGRVGNATVAACVPPAACGIVRAGS